MVKQSLFRKMVELILWYFPHVYCIKIKCSKGGGGMGHLPLPFLNLNALFLHAVITQGTKTLYCATAICWDTYTLAIKP